MLSRRKAREVAFQALYQCDVCNEWSEASLQPFFAMHAGDLFATENSSADFCMMLIRGVFQERVTIDEIINKDLTQRSIERVQKVDCALLRLAVYELLYVPEVPLRVTLNEAIELAHLFSGGKAPAFINGVLDAVTNRYAKLPILIAKREPIARAG